MRRSLRLALPLLLAGGAAAFFWTGIDPPLHYVPGPPAPTPLPQARAFSLLALGDTGETLPWRPFGEGQRSVARGLALEDRRAPVQALVLLGDNFYPDGLESRDLVERLRDNLVRPYCRFLAPGPRWSEVADACSVPQDERHPVPVLAVLGNHDYNSEESPALERETVPRFVASWSVNAGAADVVELSPELSVIRIDSERVKAEGRSEPVAAAIARARGAWRILVTHEPIALRDGRKASPGSFSALVRDAIARAGRPVQLVLTGHRHNLQVIRLDLGGRPALHVIAGGGSNRKPLREPPFRGRAFASAATGFARVDLLGTGAAQGLLVSVYTMPRYPIHFWREPRLVSRWWIGRDGTPRQAYPPPKS